VITRPPPPVVIYQPPPPVYVRPPPPPPYYYRPRPAYAAPRSEWGLNFRFDAALQGSGSASSQTMAGGGFALRYKPVPAFGLEAGFDFLGGHDYQDNQRNETAFTINTLFFVNPRSRVQLYFLAGLGGSWAHVQRDGYANPYNNMIGQGLDAHYTYFGGQVGSGLEFRVSRHFALDLDVRGFIRSRTDDASNYQPEFTDPNTGRSTNTSGGALVTIGGTLYF
jgi:opacity protein-like surface antigen